MIQPYFRAAYQNNYMPERFFRFATEASVKIFQGRFGRTHKKTFVTPKMILSLAGNFNRDSMLTRIEKFSSPSTQSPTTFLRSPAQIQMPSGRNLELFMSVLVYCCLKDYT